MSREIVHASIFYRICATAFHPRVIAAAVRPPAGRARLTKTLAPAVALTAGATVRQRLSKRRSELADNQPVGHVAQTVIRPCADRRGIGGGCCGHRSPGDGL